MSSKDGRKLVIVGAGETANIAYEYFTHDSSHSVVAFSVEEAHLKDREMLGLPVTPLETLAEAYPPEDFSLYVAISYNGLNRVRRRLFNKVKALGFRCESYISSRAFVWPSTRIGENCFVFESCVIQHHAQLGNDVTLWSGAIVTHRSVIGDDCFIASGAVINGMTRIGDRSFVGANSTIREFLSVADDSVIGMGAVVTRSIDEPGCVWVGNPARRSGKSSFDVFGVNRGLEPA